MVSVTVQLLADAVEVRAPAVADEGIAAVQFDPGDQSGVGCGTTESSGAPKARRARHGQRSLSSRVSAVRRHHVDR